VGMGARLSDQQVAFFQTYGYLGFPGLLADRIDRIIEEFESVWASRGGGHYGKPHDGKARSCIVPFIDQTEYLASLVDDPRIRAIAETFMGDDFNYMGSDGNYYAGDTGWHSDGWHPKTLHVKIAFYLDEVTRDTGCLRVIPGSHRVGTPYSEDIHQRIGRCRDEWGIAPNEVPAAALETKPGDIVCFNHNTKHAAFGGGTRRRMFTINLCERYPEERIQELRDYISGAARFWIDRVYGDAMVRTADADRMVHLEQVMANDGHLAALSQAARERMAEPSRG